MTASLQAKSNGTEGALLVNGSEAVVFDSSGITSGVNKAAVTQQATLGTAVPYTSFTTTTYHDFLSIPSWVKRITVSLDGVSRSGSSPLRIQIGDSGGVETSGYAGATSNQAGTATSQSGGFDICGGEVGATVFYGAATLVLADSDTNKWSLTAILGNSTPGMNYTGATKALSATLDRIRLTMANGTDTFDAGSINILYE